MDRMPHRRDMLKMGAWGAAGLLVPGGLLMKGSGARSAAATTSGLPRRFSTRLPLPRKAVPVRRTATTDYYEMTIQEGEAQILAGPKTRILGYDGQFPGPTIRAVRGRPVVIRQTNALGMDAVVHLHGGLVPQSEDGYPMDVIPPGGHRDYHYPNDQPSATLWYHDHTHHMEAEMVFRGLSGFYLLDDPEDRSLGLPSGPYDIPVILRDARFDANGQFNFVMGDFIFRNTVLVNGRPQPYLPVAARKYRLRLLNGSNMRYFTLQLSSGEDLTVVGSDGGLLAAPLPVKSVALSPGERVDVIVDFSAHRPGQHVVLVNSDGFIDGARNIMCFRVGEPVPDDSRIPEKLAAQPDLGTPTVTRDIAMTFDYGLQTYVMNGKTFDMNRVDQMVRRGETEIWRIRNYSFLPPVPHNFHLHGTHFQILDRDGKPVSGHETGPKDTVAVPVGSTVRLKVRYDRDLGRYLYHCHLLDHSSMGMMAQSQITA